MLEILVTAPVERLFRKDESQWKPGPMRSSRESLPS
jgi:hypothetical protein